MSDFQNMLKEILKLPHGTVLDDAIFKTFRYQYENVPIYHNYCTQIGVTNPSNIQAIPFLPISFFKTHDVIANDCQAQKTFMSSGTSNIGRSRHLVAKLSLYEMSFLAGFEQFFGHPQDCVILGLLPNYLAQGNASLIYMVQQLIENSHSKLSGFFLNDFNLLIKTIQLAKNQNKKIILFGVTYALLDLADLEIDLSGIYIIETGGMKGRRQEMVKEEMHAILKNKLKVNQIYSEYGMTELLSQAYSIKNGIFQTSKGMKILIRDTTDPLSYVANGKTGCVNVIDLFNVYSCSFIATQDLGKIVDNGFQIIGRFDQSEIRGCNLLVN